jgi:hypothetical protein
MFERADFCHENNHLPVNQAICSGKSPPKRKLATAPERRNHLAFNIEKLQHKYKKLIFNTLYKSIYNFY